MIQLSNGCRYSGVKVIPKNWKTATTTRKPWLIYYRFYDPTQTERYPHGKLVQERPCNEYKDIKQRQNAARVAIDDITFDIEKQDHNPITGYRKAILTPPIEYGINPNTPLLAALQTAHEKLEIAPATLLLNKSVLKYVSHAAQVIHCDVIPVKEIKRIHALAILEQCGKNKLAQEQSRHARAMKNPLSKPWEKVKKNTWSANTYNFYRAHLMILFKMLVTWQAIEHNPVDDYLPRKKQIKKKRQTLTPEQRASIDKGLRKDNYRFWLFMQIFFDSGGRETEMVLVKWEHVNIKEQFVRYTILKGTEYREEDRAISNHAVGFWQQALVGAKRGQYLFSKGLMPGDMPIRPEQITRRWRNWVKNRTDKDGNKVYGDDIADFYSLKHSHSTEVAGKVGTRLAALHNQHTEAVLKENYDVQGNARDMQIIKSISVPFVPV